MRYVVSPTLWLFRPLEVGSLRLRHDGFFTFIFFSLLSFLSFSPSVPLFPRANVDLLSDGKKTSKSGRDFKEGIHVFHVFVVFV